MKKHVLMFVDDEELLRQTIERIFRRLGNYKILTASSGDKALEILENEEVHVIIADYKMPSMSGLELLSKVRERHPNIVRILLTGSGCTETILSAMSRGEILHLLSKPWNNVDLMDTVREALDAEFPDSENKDKIH
jgi:DNA-binding NtrC family response regulator